MLLTFAITIGFLVACGVYLILRRSLVKLIIGLSLLTYAVNLFLLAMGDLRKRGVPIIGIGTPQRMADPLPPALILTAIVISFAVTSFMIALSYRASQSIGSDDVDALGSAEQEAQ
jgi:multisubunit Na+/H+ antiporter MnhC subunit